MDSSLGANLLSQPIIFMHSIELVSLSSGTYRSLAEEYIFVSRETVSDNRVEEVYEHNGEQFRLIAEFVNGKKHGKSELVCNANHRVASLTYVDGKLTGPCILWNTAKRIVFEGHLQDGAKDGICREFDDHGHVLFHGVYTNGEKKLFYELIEKGALKGYFYEKTLEDEILSICQFNGNSLNKHGRCLEFRSGSLVSEKYYNHGVVHYERLRIDGDTMTELDEDGNVVYEGGYMYLGEGTFLRHYRGVEYRGSGVRSYEGGFNEGYYHGQGCLYNLNDLSSNPPLFEGEWCYGYPEGMGTLYDPKDNEVRIKGKWHLGVLNGMDYASGGRQSPCSSLFHARPYHVQSRKYHRRVMICPALHFAIAHQLHQLVIASHSMNNCVEDGSLVELRLDGFPHLKKMEIGSHSFRFVNCIVLEKLPSLESVTIGSHCCCCCSSSAAAKWSDESSYESMDGQKTNDQGCFRIVHCSHLLEIEICDESCRSFCQFELSDCPSLQFIDIGKNCFQYADCYLRGIFS